MEHRIAPSRPAPPPPVPAPAGPNRTPPPDRPLPPLPPQTAVPKVTVTPARGASLDASLEASFASVSDEKAASAAVDDTPKTPASPKSADTNPFHVDLVIPFSVAPGANRAPAPIAAAYDRLISALEGEGGLRVTARPGRAGKGAEEVWVFVGASDGKVAELVARER